MARQSLPRPDGPSAEDSPPEHLPLNGDFQRPPFAVLGLEDYFAEVHRIEDAWFEAFYRGNSRVIGTSPWDSNGPMLRAVGRRHGVRDNDPRVFSIASYQAEVGSLEAAWSSFCDQQGWVGYPKEPGAREKYDCAVYRYDALRDGCNSRNFPGAGEFFLDCVRECDRASTRVPPSRAMLWRVIQYELAILDSDVIERNTGGKYVRRTYALMHGLGITWTPSPPYPQFTAQEAIDELNRIAARLEREEAEQLQGEDLFKKLGAADGEDGVGPDADDDKTPHTDGPVPPYWFWWKGNKASWKRKQKPWILLNFMWGRDSAQADDVFAAIWDETKDIATLRTNANRVNNFLPSDYRRRLSVRQVEPGRHVILWEGLDD
jgi:hypothetical protein